MKQIVTRGESKWVISLKDNPTVTVYHSPALEGHQLETYIVTLSGHEDQYQFDGERFYIDAINRQKTTEFLDAQAKEAKELEEAGKTKEEINEHFKGKGIEFIDRVEVVFMQDSIYEKVKEMITRL